MGGLGFEEFLIPIAISGIIFLIAKYLRQGKIVDGGTVEISKNLSNVFEGEIRLNGRKIDCVFDTGASVTTVNIDDAKKIGVDTSKLVFSGSADTAVGRADLSLARTQVELLKVGPIIIRDFPISVIRYGKTKCLLGMNFFSQLDSFEIANDKLVLKLAPKSKESKHDKGHREPTHSQSSSKVKIMAKCPSCSKLMALPQNMKISIQCPNCGLISETNTSNIVNGYAETHIPSH